MSFTKRARQVWEPAKVAAVVGTALCLVNDTYADGNARRIALNYVVPFLVSMYSRASLLRNVSGP